MNPFAVSPGVGSTGVVTGTLAGDVARAKRPSLIARVRTVCPMVVCGTSLDVDGFGVTLAGLLVAADSLRSPELAHADPRKSSPRAAAFHGRRRRTCLGFMSSPSGPASSLVHQRAHLTGGIHVAGRATAGNSFRGRPGFGEVGSAANAAATRSCLAER